MGACRELCCGRPSKRSARDEPELAVPPGVVVLVPGASVYRPVKVKVPVTFPVLPNRSLCTRRKSPPKRTLCFLWIHETDSDEAMVWLVWKLGCCWLMLVN